MNVILWGAQILLAIIFTLVGVIKMTQPMDKLSVNMAWVSDFPVLFVRVLGLFELLLGLLILLPRLVKPIPNLLAVYAGYVIVTIMIGAVIVHFKRGEHSFIVMNMIIIAMAVMIIATFKK
ncbi:MAG: DoxX family protein [Cytophagales bacterium]|nr:DoxX family protein [Cytophagales bacterium]